MAGRGQAGVRMWKKAAIVKPVEPATGKDGFRQPPYLRSHSAAQTAKRLKTYQSFIKKCMHNKKKRVGEFNGRLAVQKAFSECAKAWARRYGYSERTGKIGAVTAKAASEEDFDIGEEDIFWE